MAAGYRRTVGARVGAFLGFTCGVLGLLAGFMEVTWKFGPGGWFTGGSLITLLAVFLLVDGSTAGQKTAH